jgi:hypothetical protein
MTELKVTAHREDGGVISVYIRANQVMAQLFLHPDYRDEDFDAVVDHFAEACQKGLRELVDQAKRQAENHQALVDRLSR